MHSRIFELSRTPVNASDRMTDGNIPDWFFSAGCDYAVPSGQREQDIDWLTGYFRGLCSRDGSKLSFAPDIKEKCFRESYEAFKSAASALAETDYETFAGLKEALHFSLPVSACLTAMRTNSASTSTPPNRKPCSRSMLGCATLTPASRSMWAAPSTTIAKSTNLKKERKNYARKC